MVTWYQQASLPAWIVYGFDETRFGGSQVPWDLSTLVDGTSGVVGTDDNGVDLVFGAILDPGETYQVTVHLVITDVDFTGTWSLMSEMTGSPFDVDTIDTHAATAGTYDLTATVTPSEQRRIWLDNDIDEQFVWTSGSYFRVEVT